MTAKLRLVKRCEHAREKNLWKCNAASREEAMSLSNTRIHLSLSHHTLSSSEHDVTRSLEYGSMEYANDWGKSWQKQNADVLRNLMLPENTHTHTHNTRIKIIKSMFNSGRCGRFCY